MTLSLAPLLLCGYSLLLWLYCTFPFLPRTPEACSTLPQCQPLGSEHGVDSWAHLREVWPRASARAEDGIGAMASAPMARTEWMVCTRALAGIGGALVLWLMCKQGVLLLEEPPVAPLAGLTVLERERRLREPARPCDMRLGRTTEHQPAHAVCSLGGAVLRGFLPAAD